MKLESTILRMGATARILLVTLGFVLLASGAMAKKDPYIFRFGLMLQNPQGKPTVYLETKEIEKQVDPSFLHGFTIVRRDGAQFFLYYKVRFPKPLENLPKGIEQYYDVLENGRVLQSKEELVWDHAAAFTFEKSDPEGKYEMEIYTDGKLYEKFEYNVLGVPQFDF